MACDVSVIIRSSNGGAYLPAAIQAAMAQEGSNFEIVVVDDASTDSTAQVAAEASLAHPSLRVISMAEHSGRMESYRAGLRASSGTYVLFSDAPDTLLPQSLGRLFQVASQTRADILVTSSEFKPLLDPLDANDAQRPAASSRASVSPEDTGNISEARLLAADIFSDQDTGAAVRVVSPLMQTVDGEAIIDAFFRTRSVPVQLRGRLFKTELARHAFAEIEINSVASHDEAVAGFMCAILAQRLVVRPDLHGLVIAENPAPSLLEAPDFAAICANRSTAEVAVGYLNRSEQWERYYDAWEGLAVGLVRQATDIFPARVQPVAWADAATELLNSWGAPYIAAALEDNDDSDLCSVAIALASSAALAQTGARPHNLAILVREGDDLVQLRKLQDSLASRRTSCSIIAEEGAATGSLAVAQTIPAYSSTLERARELSRILCDLEIDGLVLSAGDVRGVYDELVARAQMVPVALIATEPIESVAAYRAIAAQVALASCVVPATGVDSELWSLLGVRIASLGGLVASLSLGTTRADLNARRLALQLNTLVRSYQRSIDNLKESCAHAIDRNGRMETQIAGLKDRCANLEGRLEEAVAERDELERELESLRSSGIFSRLRHKGK